MKKLLQLFVTIIISYSTIDAALINSLHIKNRGTKGFDDVGEYEGVFIHRKWCINPGALECPFLCNCYTVGVHPSEEAYKISNKLLYYQQDFIKSSLLEADNSLDSTGLISGTFVVDGEIKILTAKYTKTESSFIFDVVENSTYEDNLKELEKK